MQRIKDSKPEKPFYKKLWFWLVTVIALFVLGSIPLPSGEKAKPKGPTLSLSKKSAKEFTKISGTSTPAATIKFVDSAGMTESKQVADEHGKFSVSELPEDKYKVTAYKSGHHSKSVKLNVTKDKSLDADSDYAADDDDSDSDTSVDSESSSSSDSVTPAGQDTDSTDESSSSSDSQTATSDDKAALNSAKYYSNDAHMSQAGLYQQLTSDAGDKFTPEAAQYAIDNLHANWDDNALQSAKEYQSMGDMSTAEIHDQLTSQAGEQFTQEQADYAIAHLNQ